MRIVAAKPETEWRSGLPLSEKVVEVLERRSGRIPLTSAGLEAAGSPALSRVADGIAGGLEQIGIHGVRLRQEPVQVGAFLEAMDGLTGQERSPRRRA